jgi:hypothetical protein
VLYGLDPTNKATDSTGTATLGPLPAGSVDVIATPNATGRPSSRQQVYVRPGWITAPMMFPTPQRVRPRSARARAGLGLSGVAGARYVRGPMRRRRGAFGMIGVVVAMAGVFACRQIVGFTDGSPVADASPADGSPAAPTSSACGLPYGTSECAACVSAKCCAASSVCAEDPACFVYEGCLGACGGDPSCRRQCFIDHPSAYTTPSMLPALAACLDSNCETPCGLACGAVGSVLATSPDAAAGCQSCVQANACKAGHACASSTECIEVDQCGRGCSTLDCREACTIGRDAGAALATPTQQALVGSCASQCGLGRDWSCVGNVSWPVTQSPTVTMTVAVETSGGSLVLGADVAVSQYCPQQPEGGLPSLQDGQTDGMGTVTLTVPQSTTAGPGINHGLDGCLTVTAPGYLQTFWYWGFPLTARAVEFIPDEPGGASDWVPLLTTADVTALNSLAGTTVDPSRGVVGVTLLDCEGGPAPGVKIDIGDPAIRVLYGTSFSAMLTASDSTALAFLVNVPAGAVTLTATPIALGKPSSRITVNVAASTFTEVLMFPTP